MDRPDQLRLQLRLYVHGDAPETAAVERNLHEVFASIGLDYDVEILDVRAHADEAEADKILLTPTLIRLTPPQLRVAGDLADVETALDGLGLRIWSQRARARPMADNEG
ncbi:circadian clock KaiB family protein [Egicoccus sp. AB-alg6-2]|uniref:circadian clock KaiB family protein n=1 Tax=Egicoccus sp. AB-alg6-2 TaxID=3242692 RepID=UPI00359DECF6